MTRAEMYQKVREALKPIECECEEISGEAEYKCARCRALDALEAEERDTERLLNVARGCHDYGGGYREDREAEIFHHGIQTVINALEAFMKAPNELQVRVLEGIGASTPTAPPAAECAARNALRNLRALDKRAANPYGHDCYWCVICCKRSADEADAALAAPCECQRLRGGLEAWKEEFGTDNPELAALESKNFGASEMVRVIADIESPGVIGDPTAQEIRERLRELAAAKSEIARLTAECEDHLCGIDMLNEQHDLCLDEIIRLDAELRQAMDAMRPFEEYYRKRDRYPTDPEYAIVAGFVAAYDAKHREKS